MGNGDTLYRQLLSERRIRLMKTELQDVFRKNSSYSVDKDGNVSGLNLSGQRIANASFLKPYRTLQLLDLSNNRISDISFISELNNLTRLNISHNHISDILNLKELKKLKELDISGNKLSTIPLDILDWDMEINWGDENLHDTLARSIFKKKSIDEFLREFLPEIGLVNESKTGIEENFGGDEKKQKKILVVAANPRLRKGHSPIKFDQEIRDITDYLQFAESRNQFDLKIGLALRQMDLQRILLNYKPNIIQFIGHGTEEGLIVEDEFRFAVTFSPEALSNLFSLFPNHIECVILNTCHSTAHAELISKHIETVIGMNNEIKDRTAIIFSVGFYSALAAGRSYSDAFQFGKIAIQTHYPDEEEHLIPRLYLKKKGNPVPGKGQNLYRENKAMPREIDRNLDISESLKEWCLKTIFSDQYETGDNIAGGWSKRYPQYQRILSNSDNKVLDSITFSCWIAEALFSYKRNIDDIKQIKDIQERIDRFYKYLFGHYDSKTGGFGISVHYSSGENKIAFDLRHTAWALLALTKSEKDTPDVERMIRMSCSKISEILENMGNELPVTISILHRILTDYNIRNKIFMNDQIVRRKLKQLELSLINNFNADNYCWGWFNDRSEKMAIDNALSIMYNVDYNLVVDEELKNQFKSVLNYLAKMVCIDIDKTKIALPIEKGDEPDLGATILFYCILKRANFKPDSIFDLQKLVNFINDPESRKKYTHKFSFPWHVSSILR